ncbi:LysR family transcriptional regulator [Streptomyces sp. DSM 41527]|uniref:LysR family transcriptional regulator n=1 Tax=Streptomyces mooreae TaxID=3075523 RepID=A0ABU2TI99_9ACTN|nr:LysR family transcriptional regulator [Streptomyces sp. DSM 41527]MDT0460647.1 LysR family transcriptional regulator [Streptomyces sp. DSM 41527]
MNIELRHFRYAIAVAEELSFTRAARRLHVAQSALSARIKGMEAELGVALFHRTTRRVELTEAGKRFITEAELSLRHHEEALRQAREAASGARARLKVGFQGAAALELTPLILEAFEGRCPGVEVEMCRYDWDDPSAGVNSQEVDAAFVRPPFQARGLTMEPLFAEPRVAALPHRHRFAGRPHVHLTELLDEPFVLRRSPDRIWVDYWMCAAHRRRTDMPRRVEVSSADDELQAVAAGRAISITPAAAARFYPRSGIVYVPVEGVSPSTVALAWSHGATNPAVAAFAKAVRQACRTRPQVLRKITEPVINKRVSNRSVSPGPARTGQ